MVDYCNIRVNTLGDAARLKCVLETGHSGICRSSINTQDIMLIAVEQYLNDRNIKATRCFPSAWRGFPVDSYVSAITDHVATTITCRHDIYEVRSRKRHPATANDVSSFYAADPKCYQQIYELLTSRRWRRR